MANDEKIDLYKENKADYVAKKKPSIVNIKKAAYLAVSGVGAPGGDEFQERIGALYGMAFTTKMTRKFAGLGDYTVCKLECQWWADDDSVPFSELPQVDWHWKLLIRTPSVVKKKDLAASRKTLNERGKGECTDLVDLESFSEGKCVQMLHVGPYDTEYETLAVMKEYAESEGLEFHGKHHEIYLSDPRRVEPERLKTILRMPVKRV